MKFFKLKKSRNRVHHTRRYPIYAGIAVVAALVLALAVVSILKSRTDGTLAANRRHLASQIQVNLSQAASACEKSSLPGANLPGDILPAMRLYLYAASELDDVMMDSFGADSSMIDETIFSQIDLSITQIERAIQEGKSTAAMLETLRAYMGQLEQDLEKRFAGTELLMSRGSLK